MTGLLMSLNFLLFWALPVGGMGYIYKAFFKQFLKPIYDFFDKNSVVRSFAENYIYTKPEHADYFVISSLLTINCIISLSTLFYWQLFVGDLPWWLIGAYYCSWVGIGGSMMGAAYGLAHVEVLLCII
jgi:hypothetical protein